jgi:DNA invertase Pin-like site-specific DNA recombinase
MIAVWSSDRLGRSLKHLVEVLETIRDTGTGLYIHTQAIDTTTPAGRAMFQMLGVFSELEREMIAARVNAGLSRVKEALAREGNVCTGRHLLSMAWSCTSSCHGTSAATHGALE